MTLEITIKNPANSEEKYVIHIDKKMTVTPYFIGDGHGEGMWFHHKQLFNYLDKWYKENM